MIKSSNQRHIVYVYNSMRDPLFRGNLLRILERMALDRGSTFYVITAEQKEFAYTRAEADEWGFQLRQKNIIWYPLTWHTASGPFKLVVKGWDWLFGLFVVIWLRLRFRPISIIGLSTVSGSFAYLYSRLVGIRFYGYQYEPHSAFMLDFGYWKSNSIAYRMLNRLEWISIKGATVISTASDVWIEQIRRQSNIPVFKLPSCVDMNQFQYDAEARTRIRAKLRFGNEFTITYLGKFGGIYYSEEVFQLLGELHKISSDYRYCIFTRDEPSQILNWFDQVGIPETHYRVQPVSFDEVPEYLSASDLGLVTVPGFPSQRYRSPIKVGEYLGCGLPYVVCRGVSEDDLIAEQYKVGIVITEYSKDAALYVKTEIEKLRKEDPMNLRERCRRAGIAYRGFETWVPQMHAIFDVLEAPLQ